MLLLALVLIASSNLSVVTTNVPKNKVPKTKVPKPEIGGPNLPKANQPLVSFKPFSIEIHNDMQMFILDTHCFSKNDDLGLHILFPDEVQSWSFHGNWLGTTDFHCRLEWEDGILEFEAFYRNIDLLTNYCSNSICVWSARQDGIYLYNRDNQPVFYDYWDMLR